MVVANAVAALAEIGRDDFMNRGVVNKLLTALNECTEWGQIFILDSVAEYSPQGTVRFSLSSRSSSFSSFWPKVRNFELCKKTHVRLSQFASVLLLDFLTLTQLWCYLLSKF